MFKTSDKKPSTETTVEAMSQINPAPKGGVEPENFDWLKIGRIDSEFAPDAVRIRNALESLGFQCSLLQAYELWRAYSVKHNKDDPANPLNNWFPLPDSQVGVISKLKFNILPEMAGIKP